MKRLARISECGLFRYALERTWDMALPPLIFFMLNPSTADGEVDDNTILACIAIAKLKGYGSIIVVNLFAYRTSKPKELAAAGWPDGPLNVETITTLLQGARKAGGRVVCAWGAHGRGRDEPAMWLRHIRAMGITPYALGFTSDGIPRHPLYLRRSSPFLEIPA